MQLSAAWPNVFIFEEESESHLSFVYASLESVSRGLIAHLRSSYSAYFTCMDLTAIT